jgi:hypothetical protein
VSEPADTLVLDDKPRLIVPLISLAIVGVMFLPVVVMVMLDPRQTLAGYWIGAAVMIVSILALLFRALKAPYRLTVSRAQLRIDRVWSPGVYTIADIAEWKIAQADKLPQQAAPKVNGLLLLKLADGTRFRSEITREQAIRWIAIVGASSQSA